MLHLLELLGETYDAAPYGIAVPCGSAGSEACAAPYTEQPEEFANYVKAIQEAEPMINADPLKCERDASGKCVKVNLCYGDYRSGASDCTAPAEPRAWSSPIYVDYK